MTYNNELLSIIDMLHTRIQNQNLVLWEHEKTIINLSDELKCKNEKIEELQHLVEYQEDEIHTMSVIIDVSDNVSNYCKLQAEKEKIREDYDKMTRKYNDIAKNLLDIEITL